MSENRKRPAVTSNLKMNSKGGDDSGNNEESVSSTTGNSGDASKRIRAGENSNGGRRVSGNVVLGERNEELRVPEGHAGRDLPRNPNIVAGPPPQPPRDPLQQEAYQEHLQNLRVAVNNEAPPSVFPGSSHHSSVLDLSRGPQYLNQGGLFPFRPPEFAGSSILQQILNQGPTAHVRMPDVKKYFGRLPIPEQEPIFGMGPYQNQMPHGGLGMIPAVRPGPPMLAIAEALEAAASQIQHRPVQRAPPLQPSFSGAVLAAGFNPNNNQTFNHPMVQHPPPSPQHAPPPSAPVFATPAGVSADAISKDIGNLVPLAEGHHKVNSWLNWEGTAPSTSGLPFEPQSPMDVQLTRFETTFSVSLSPTRVAYLNDMPVGVSKANWLEVVRIVMDRVLDVNLTVYSSSELPTNELTFWNPFYRFDMLFRVAKCLVGGANTANLLRMSSAESLLTLESTYCPPAGDMIGDTKGIIRVLGDKTWSNLVIQILTVIFPERRNPDSPEHLNAQPSQSLAIQNHLFSLFKPLVMNLPSTSYQQSPQIPESSNQDAINYGRTPENFPPNQQSDFYRGPQI